MQRIGALGPEERIVEEPIPNVLQVIGSAMNMHRHVLAMQHVKREGQAIHVIQMGVAKQHIEPVGTKKVPDSKEG